VQLVGSSGEFGEGGNSIANIKAAKDIGEEDFTKKSAIAEAMLVGQLSMGWSAFSRARFRVVEIGDLTVGERRAGFGGGLMFGWSLPVVGLEEATNIGLCREADVVRGLENVVAIVVSEKAKVLKGDNSLIGEFEFGANEVIGLLGCGFSRAGKGKVVDLAGHEDGFPKEVTFVDVLLMGSVGEAKVSKDAIDVCFPEATSFGVALESAEDGDDKRAVKFGASASFIPFGKGIVNAKEGGFGRTRGVSVGIFGITTIDDEVVSSSQGDKETEHGMLNAGGVGGCALAELRSSTLGAIAAGARAAFAIGFDAIVPMEAKKGGTFGEAYRVTKHAKSLHLIQLGTFIFMPEGPCGKSLEGTAGEAGECTLFRGNGF